MWSLALVSLQKPPQLPSCNSTLVDINQTPRARLGISIFKVTPLDCVWPLSRAVLYRFPASFYSTWVFIYLFPFIFFFFFKMVTGSIVIQITWTFGTEYCMSFVNVWTHFIPVLVIHSQGLLFLLRSTRSKELWDSRMRCMASSTLQELQETL